MHQYSGVDILEYSNDEYCFCYLGRLINDQNDQPLLLKKEDDPWINKHKTEGFIDCLIALGYI
jgi:hypothetical protein